MPEDSRGEVARQVILGFASGLASAFGVVPGAVAQAAVPVALAALHFMGRTRLQNDVELMLDAGDAYEAQTGGDFDQFVQAAVSDAEHQELLARALTIGQDTAMRDKRRALGRALASAASDTGTKVDTEMLFMRVLEELDAPHIRLLRLMSTPPPSLDRFNRVQRIELGEQPIRQWHPPEIAELDPGLGEVMWSLLPVLNRLGLIDGNPGEYTITGYGEYFLERLAEPESGQG